PVYTMKTKGITTVRAVQLILFILFSFVYATAGVPITVTERLLEDNPELLARVDTLRGLPHRDASGDWEQPLTHGARSSVKRGLIPVAGELAGIAVREERGMDLLVSAWKTSTPGIRSIWVLDEPEYNPFIVGYEPESAIT